MAKPVDWKPYRVITGHKWDPGFNEEYVDSPENLWPGDLTDAVQAFGYGGDISYMTTKKRCSKCKEL